MGQEGEFIPRGATHIFVHESVTVILRSAFANHLNIVEVICHEDVVKIEGEAFFDCTSLKRVIMPGVTIVEEGAFGSCHALTDVECGKLEIIGKGAFYSCASLESINLPSTRIVERRAFRGCRALTDAKFGSKLERIEEGAFLNCGSLQRITIPLRDDMITNDNTFFGCAKLNRVGLVEGKLNESIAALHLGEWRIVMNEEIDSINQILPNADAGQFEYGGDAEGEKAVAIRTWIRSLLGKIVHYKAEHSRLLDEDVAPTLQRFVPQDTVMNSILPFLNLPSYSFEG